MSKRMFVAIDLPRDFTAKLDGINPRLQGLRWLPTTQLHLTLCFIGNVPGEDERPLIDALAKIEVVRFELSLKGVGCFSHRGGGMVVWSGLRETPEELSHMQEKIVTAVRHAGLNPDDKRFHPHVTLARGKNLKRSQLQPFLSTYQFTEFGSFEANCFVLYASVLAPDGVEHLPVFRNEAAVTPPSQSPPPKPPAGSAT